MKELYLLRHAKSSWAQLGAKDFDRPLNNRGREAAHAMGGFLKDAHLKPDLILCSSARRTRQTLERIKPQLTSSVSTTFRDQLYHAAAETILATVRAAPDLSNRLLIIGHNPGMHESACALVDPKTSDQVAALLMTEEFPTACLAQFTFDVAHWRDVAWGAGALTRFVRPKDLATG
ncbi:MAG: histidine phosphatase family protein [Pseudomonadota bacterium]